MRHNTLLGDVAVALAVMLLVLVIAPGFAIVAILALFVLLVCGVSFTIAGWRRRGARRRAARSRPPPPL